MENLNIGAMDHVVRHAAEAAQHHGEGVHRALGAYLASGGGRVELAALRADFERLVQPRSSDEHGKIAVDAAALRQSPALSWLAVDPYLTALVSYYWGRPIVLAQSGGSRLLPSEVKEYGSFQWPLLIPAAEESKGVGAPTSSCRNLGDRPSAHCVHPTQPLPVPAWHGPAHGRRNSPRPPPS